MPDFDSTHGIVAAVTGTGGAGIMGGLMAWLRSSEARQARDALINLQGTVQRLVDDVREMKAMGAQVNATSAKADRLHERVDAHADDLDDLKARVGALEGHPVPQRRPRKK